MSTQSKLQSINAVCNGKVDKEVLKSEFDTDKLAQLLCELMGDAQTNVEAMQEAVHEIEVCQNENRANNKQVIELQKKLINSSSNQEEKFAEQIKTFSDVVSASVGSVPAKITKTFKQVVQSTVVNRDKEKNIIVFGMEEIDGEDLEHLVSDLLLSINLKPKFTAVRIGAGQNRPIKVVTVVKAQWAQINM